jgi:enoyl-CoA hydratase/carnithine racemase
MKYIKSEAAGGVRSITLNRPEALNAINADMHGELEQAFNAFAEAEDEHVFVITGSGRAFCAGPDLKSAIAEGRRPYPARCAASQPFKPLDK